MGLFCLRFNVAAAAVVNFDNLASQSRSQSKFEFNGHRGCTCAWCLMPPLVGLEELGLVARRVLSLDKWDF